MNDEEILENSAEEAKQGTDEQALNEDLETKLEALNIELFDLKTRLALLLSGAAKERLDEGAKLCAGICKTGKTPEQAAAEIMGEYPHLRAVRREMPQLCACGVSENDGFAAVRKIFSAKGL